MTRTLYTISDDLAALAAILDEEGGDISSESAAAALDAWEAELATDIAGKVDSYCSLIAEMEARSNARAIEATRLSVLAKRDAASATSLRERLRYVWEARALGKIHTARFAVSLAANGGKQKLTVSLSPEDLPEWAIQREVKITTNTDAIRERIDAGESIEFARLEPRGNRINIK